MQRLVTGQSAEKSHYWVLSPKQDIYTTTTIPQDSGDILEKGEERL